MVLFDIIVIILLVLISLAGLYRGAFVIIIEVLFFILTIQASWYLFPILIPIFEKYTDNYIMVTISSYVISYLIILLPTFIIEHYVKKMCIINNIINHISGLLIGNIIFSIILVMGVIIIQGIYGGAINYMSSQILNHEKIKIERIISPVITDIPPEWLKNSIIYSNLLLPVTQITVNTYLSYYDIKIDNDDNTEDDKK